MKRIILYSNNVENMVQAAKSLGVKYGTCDYFSAEEMIRDTYAKFDNVIYFAEDVFAVSVFDDSIGGYSRLNWYKHEMKYRNYEFVSAETIVEKSYNIDISQTQLANFLI